MKRYATTKQVIKNTKNFLKIKHYTFRDKLFKRCGVFYGWGRKKSGLQAIELAKKCNSSFVLLEDGFIRSVGLGIDGFPSFSLVEDDIGIYYDATTPSKLENILNTYDFAGDTKLMEDARRALELIRTYEISKYNDAPRIDNVFLAKYALKRSATLHSSESEATNILIIAQTDGDASLKYGMLDHFTTDAMIAAAMSENPHAKVFLKIHPDVLSGKKKSDVTLENLDTRITLIKESVNPISLLKHFDKVYTKTSGMGFEALIMGCECVCFGMPFYAGWGVTIDKSTCHRRKQKRTVEEIFAAAYILYTRYVNPSTKQECTIFEVIEEIIAKRDAGYKNCR